ncbi:MAG: hypothetical protein ACTSV5_12250 [Promethearchaeota archaeon]
MIPGFIPKNFSNNPRISAEYDPASIIALWSGPLNTIPVGWKLSDGTGGTINTTNRFVYNPNNMDSPRSTGGSSSHNHTYSEVPYHDHGVTSTNSANHRHSYGRPNTYRTVTTNDLLEFSGLRRSLTSTGTSSVSHNHGGYTTYTGSTPPLYMSEEENVLPPYYEMAFIEKETNDPTIPIGLIVMWAGTIDTIPADWELCNGSNGTPDLREKFIRGAPLGEDPGTIGGDVAHNHTYTEIPNHRHSIDSANPSHSHSGVRGTSTTLSIDIFVSRNVYKPTGGYTSYANAPHIHTVLQIGQVSCTTENAENLPPLFKVAFIMNTVVSNAVPVGAISMWGDSIENMPPGWNQCNGTNNTPDMFKRFPRGVATGEQPGIVGGFTVHRHIYTEVPLHTHTVLNDNMRHRHSITTNSGSESAISRSKEVYSSGSGTYSTDYNTASHNQDINPSGVVDPYNSFESSIPPYVKLIYIQKSLSLYNPSPQDGATDISYNPTLNVDLNDLEGDDLTVSFYDALDDSLIDNKIILGGSGTASVTWTGLSPTTNYSWYAISDDGLSVNQSATWSFTTATWSLNHVPNAPTNPVPSDLAYDVDDNLALSVDVSDDDGDTLTVTFYNASDNSVIGSDTVTGGSGTASVTWSWVSSEMTCKWYVIADDGMGATQSSTWTFTTYDETNIPPSIPLPGLIPLGIIVIGTTGILSVITHLRRKRLE